MTATRAATRATLTRRRFAKGVAAAGLASAMGCAARRQSERRPILIAGAGLCGLTLCHELRRRGHEVVVLEASERAGGRILTLREGFAEGLRGEAGAERVPLHHEHLRTLCRELHVSLMPYPDVPGRYSMWIDGGQWPLDRLEDAGPLFEGLSSLERECAPLHLHLGYVETGRAPDPGDPRNGLQWLRDQGLTERGEVFLRSFCLLPMEEMSAFDFFQETLRERDAFGSEVVVGGTDRIVEELYARHRDVLRLGCEVVGAELRREDVRIRTVDGQSFAGELCLLCLPMGPLRALDPALGWPAEIRESLRGLVPAGEIKLHWELEEQHLASGRIPVGEYGGRFPRATWPLPERASGRLVMNTIALPMDTAEVNEAHAQGPARFREFLAQRAPLLTESATTIRCHNFLADPRAGAAYVFRAPGMTTRLGARRVGRLIWTGADLSALSGWMEGAVLAAHEALALTRSPGR